MATVKIIELVGTSAKSWRAAVEEALRAFLIEKQ
jgi:flavin-binding protein dodecin